MSGDTIEVQNEEKSIKQEIDARNNRTKEDVIPLATT